MSRFTAKTWVNVALCLAAIGLMVFFTYCTSACSYFRGSLLGIDLKIVGVLYMAVLIILSLLRWDPLVGFCLGAGLGGEVLLVAFQVRQGRYCPFCLSFGAIVVVLFAINFRWSRKWVTLAAIVVGFLAFLACFKGSFVPTFQLPVPIPVS